MDGLRFQWLFAYKHDILISIHKVYKAIFFPEGAWQNWNSELDIEGTP